MLPYLPSADDIIEEATASGWEHAVYKGNHVLRKVDDPVVTRIVILQPLPQGARYGHPVGVSHARRLGLKIAGEDDPGGWAPSEEEET